MLNYPLSNPPLAKEDQKLFLAKPRLKPVRVRRRLRAAAQGMDQDLFNTLRAWRKQAASEAGIAAFVVFSDATLVDLAVKKPKTRSELLKVSGIGEHKANKYGEQILGLIPK